MPIGNMCRKRWEDHILSCLDGIRGSARDARRDRNSASDFEGTL
jgi:hypothetical protein